MPRVRDVHSVSAMLMACVGAGALFAQPAQSAQLAQSGQSARSAFRSSQQHAVVTLLAEHTAAVPSQPLSVGVHFELDPHWHIYWRNPGDSGGPPTIEWTLPDGFHASEFQWPAPQRIPIGGSLMNYGYEEDVLLPLTIRVPVSAKPGTPVTLTGSLKYLICSELCVPGRADVKLTLPIASSAGAPSPSAALFAQTRTRIPQPAPSTWSTRASFANRQFDLAIDTGQRETSAQFFPLFASQIDDAAPQQTTPTARGIRFTLRASDQLTAAPRTLSGVVVLADHRAYTIEAPVAGANGHRKSNQ